MSQVKRFSYGLELITLIGLLFYLAQSWYFATSLDSIGDEGSYLYKGYLFARGDVYPFQEYTFWTNKAPLSFVIPGYIQLWFGPGLAEGRYFAIFLGLLMMVAIWITARRLGGRAWAALAVWVFALAHPQILVYSEAVSQGLVACLMAWMFAFTLGEDRPLWQLMAGSALAILIVMTRQNMALVPALLVLYIFWQHGARAGVWSLATSAALFLVFHLAYWPGILQIWAPWLPRSLTPFLDTYRTSAQLTGTDFQFDASSLSRYQSLVTGLHDHFFVFFGSVAAVILWPRRESWKSSGQFKMAVFLGLLFLSLFLMHTWASLPTDYCVHCFSAYQAFYTTAGFFFLLVVFSNGPDTSKWRLPFLVSVALVFAAGMGLYYFQRWGDWLLDHVRILRVNRLLRQGDLSTIPLRDIFTHSLDLPLDLQRRFAAVGAGLFIGLLLILLAWAVYRFFLRNRSRAYAFANVLVAVGLLAGSVFPAAFDARAVEANCTTKFLTYYEEAAESLDDLIPPGSVVYWRGSGRHLAFLLYVDDVKLFLPQIHAGGGYMAGNTQELSRLGLFNQEMDLEWRESADILIIWDTYFTKEFRDFFAQPGYERLEFDMGDLAQCEDVLHVFRRTS